MRIRDSWTALACAAGLAFGVAHAGSTAMKLGAGDVLTKQQENGAWTTVKVLVIESWPDGSDTAHCMTYADTPRKPDLDGSAKLEVRVMHAPIAASSFATWEKLGNRAVRDDELAGFELYLKLTDFPRYLEFTKQDAGAVVSRANRHYERAIELGDAGKRREAIAEYEKAIDLFPLFFEAIDNRAFVLMELGEYRAALAGFEDSLRVEPNGFSAVFSHAECLLRLDEFASAEREFAAGAQRFPEHRAEFEKYRDLARRRVNPGRK